MGEHGQSFLRSDVEPADAVLIAGEIRDWLIAEDIITGEIGDFALSGLGHAPGPNWAAVAERPDAGDPRVMRTNGVVISGGTPQLECYPNGADLRPTCPSCREKGADGLWNAVKAWTEWTPGQAVPIRSCEHCGVASSILDQQFEDRSLGLGLLGVTFWNWPILSDAFGADLTRRLGGNAFPICGKM